MSRNPASWKCFGIFVGLIILSAGFAVPAIAQIAASFPMIPAPQMPPTNPAYSSHDSTLFIALLDDVILKKRIESDVSELRLACELNAPCDGNCPADCRCTKEMAASEADLEEACEEADEWAALMTCPCDLKNCGGGCEVPTDFVDPTCSSFDCDGCQDCNVPINQADDYCQQIARLLTATLENSKASPQAKQQAVEAAMKLVAQKALETADSRMAELKVEHARAIRQMELKLVRANTQTESMREFQTWLRPIYNNQNRNYQQLKLIASRSTSLHRTIAAWEQTMLTEMAKVPIRQDDSWQEPQQGPTNRVTENGFRSQLASPKPINPVETEVAKLKRELAEMAQRIDNLQSDSVRPASHLEPIYVPDAQLQPLMPDVKTLPRYRR